MVSRGRSLDKSVTTLTSRSNTAYKEARALVPRFDGKYILVEGSKLIGEAMRAGLTPFQSWSIGAWQQRPSCAGYEVTPAMYKVLSPTKQNQGPLVIFEAPVLESFNEKQVCKGQWLFLDQVQDPGNAGALVRAATAFGFTGVLWHQPCVYPFHHAVIRASAGSVFHKPQVVIQQLPSKMPLPLIGSGGNQAQSLDIFSWPRDLILVMGNEGHGMSSPVAEQLTTSVEIPIDPDVESLNVAGAAHILMHQISTKIRKKTSS